MGINKELNPPSFSACTQELKRYGETTPGSSVQNHFKDYLKLLKKRKLRLVQTADIDYNYRNILEASPLKTFKTANTCCTKETLSGRREQKIMNFQQRVHRKNEYIEEIGSLELGLASWIKKLLKPREFVVPPLQAPKEPAGSWESKGTTSRREEDQNIEIISASELKKALESGNPPYVLDVREKKELSGKLGHLENSTNIPVGSLEKRVLELEDVKDREIVTVCRSGVRAVTAAQILIRAGFRKVKVLKGGMIAWRNMGN